MLQIIDRYILKMFFGFSMAGLIVFITIFLAIDAMSISMQFPAATGESLYQYYLAYLPEIVYLMIPVACLVGVIFTLSTLNKSSELLALFASGIGLLRICLPIIISVIVISIVSFVVADDALPRFVQIKNFTYYHKIKMKPSQYSTVKTDRIWYRSSNSIFNIKTVNRAKQTAEGLTLYQFNDDWDLIQMITAKKIDLLGQQWKLSSGSVTLFTKGSSFPMTQEFKTKVIVIDEELQDIQSTFNSVDVLSLHDLKKYIQKNKEAGLDTISLEVGYQDKFAFALTALVMTLIGVPFSVNHRRGGGAMVNTGFSILLVVIFWTIRNSALSLGHHGHLPPILAAWGANLLMGFISLLLMFRLKK
jgi:lipopolysaccharide export system permease protein